MFCPVCSDNTLQQEYPASDLYLQLKYYERLFSFDKWHQKLENERKEQGKFRKFDTFRGIVFISENCQYFEELSLFRTIDSIFPKISL